MYKETTAALFEALKLNNAAWHVFCMTVFLSSIVSREVGHLLFECHGAMEMCKCKSKRTSTEIFFTTLEYDFFKVLSQSNSNNLPFYILILFLVTNSALHELCEHIQAFLFDIFVIMKIYFC